MSAGQLQPDDRALCHQRRPPLPPFLLTASLAVLLGVLRPELPLVAQPLEAGAPLITSLKPKAGDDASGLQVWAITEDDRGILYVGNNAGVVEYDGVDWRVLPVRNHSTVRSLSRGPDGTIYVGAQNEVGFLRPAGDGAVEYVSLFEHLPAEERRFADVWKTYATEHGVFFQTYKSLLLWDGQQFLSWRPQEGGSFHFSYWVADELLIADLGRGLVRWTPRGLEPFPGGELFKGMKIYAVVPLKDGRLLIAPRESSLYTLHEGRVTAFPTSVDRLLVEGSIYHALSLDDGTVALATIHHGIVVIDQQGQLVRRIDRKSGLDTNRIAFLYTDRQRALWAALEQGVARIDLPSAFSQFGVADGLEGLPLAIQRVGPKLYIASTAGLYRLEAGQRDESGVALRPYLRRMPGITQQAWNLLVFDDRLLISTLDGVYEFFDRPPRLVWPGRASWLYHSKRNPKRVFVALFDGLASIRREDDRWIKEGRWPGIETDIRSLAEDENGVLWVGTAYEHVLRISLDHETGRLLEVQNLGEEYWPVPVDQFWVFETSRGVGIASNRGLFRYNEARDRFEHDTTFGEEFGNGEQGVSFVVEDAAGDVWIVPSASGEMKVARKQPDGSYRPEETPLQRLQPETVLAVYSEPDGIIWLGSTDGLHRYEPKASVRQSSPPQVLIRRVVSLADERLLIGRRSIHDNSADPIVISHRDNSLRFDFAVPGLPSGLHGGFRSRIDGIDDDWLEGTDESRHLAGLSPGEYVLSVRASDADGRVGPVTRIAFLVEAPWYREWWAMLSGALGVALLLGSAQSALSRRARERARVQSVHERRRDELATARLLQRRLLPSRCPESELVEMAAHQQTATEVGGDYYDFFPRENGDLFIAVGDATGHGMAAGLMVTATKSALLALRQDDVGEAVRRINSVLGRIGLESRLNMGLSLLRLKSNDHGLEMTACGGGVVPIFVLLPNGRLQEVVLAGLPLGALESATYEVHRKQLEPNSFVVLMSDGLPEMSSRKGEQLGYDRLQIELEELARKAAATPTSADEMLQQILGVAKEWAGSDAEPEDDLTVVVLRVR